MAKEINAGQKYILHSSNGHDYDVRVVSVNYYRPPEQWYAVDIWDNNGIYYGDVVFVGDAFFESCELVKEE